MPKESNFTIRLSKAAKELNVGKDTIVGFLAKKGFQVDHLPNTKLTADMYALLVKEYQGEKEVKHEALKLGNLSYKGGSVSVESIVDNVSGTAPANEEYKEKVKIKQQKQRETSEKKKLSEQHEKSEKKSVKAGKGDKPKVELQVKLFTLIFSQGLATITYKKKRYTYEDPRITDYHLILELIFKHCKLSRGEKHRIRTTPIKVELDSKDRVFTFKDVDICNFVNNLKEKLLSENRMLEPHDNIRLSRAAKEFNVSMNTIVEFLSNKGFQIEQIPDTKLTAEMYALLVNECFDYVNNPKKQHLFQPSIGQPENNKAETRNKIRLSKAARLFNMSKEAIIEFLSMNGFTIINPLPNTKLTTEMYELLVKKFQGGKDAPQKPSTAYEKMTLGTSNIHFYNGYYLIFQTNNGEIDNTVTPYRVNDPNSHEILNLVHKYFEQIFEQKRIIVKIDETKIIEPSKLDLFQLSNYVRELKRNLDEKDVWWEEVQNARKRSFVQCCGEPTESVKKRVVKSKNEYLYNLSSLQNEKKLIRVYEINHGKEEDAFIFTISMSNNRCAIVFENASKDASTTTWIFVAKDEDYEPCINLVFDYFTDYTVSLKRSSLRSTINPPEKFKAESYAFIYHDDIGQWLKKLNKILGQMPEPSEIQFVPGLHIPESSETRTGHGDTITTKHLHNQLMRKLYDKLCVESGKDNVGTEIRVGAKRIDTVVKGKDFFDIYEIKTATNPFDCVTEALGQLCQYAYLYCPDKIGKLVIVGPSETTKEVEQYLSTLRKNHSLQLYYMKV